MFLPKYKYLVIKGERVSLFVMVKRTALRSRSILLKRGVEANS